MIAEGLFYTKQHEWAKIKDSFATIGITDYAQKMLGEIVFVELPTVGKEVQSDNEIAIVESTKAASDLFSPVTGKVAEVNSVLESDPGLINQDCYNAGWICKIEITDETSVESLLNEEEYDKFLKGSC